MINKFETNVFYYVKYTIPSEPKGSFMQITMNPTTYRINGGSWNTYNGTFSFSYDNTLNSWFYNDGTAHFLFSGNTIEFYGKCSSPFEPTTHNWDDLLKSALKSPYVFNVYQLKCEQNKVNKSEGGSLSFVDHLYGVLREETNILNPSILIEYDSFPTFDYIHISSFNRYYFVTNITCVRNNIYRIDLKVDVLYSFSTDIKKQYGFISRCEVNNAFATNKIDERVPLSKIPTIDLTKMSLATAIRVFNPKQNDSSIKNIALTIVGTSSLAQISKTLYKPTYAQNLPDVHSFLGHTSSLVTFAISLSDWKTISDLLLTDDTLSSYIASAIMYPFALNNDCNVGAGLISISLGSTSTGVSGYYMYGHLSDYTCQYDISIPKKYSDELDFLNYEPYSKYEMYIPYKGYVELDAHKVVGKDIALYYVHDYQNGISLAFIYNETDDYLMDTYQVSIGTMLSITTTNARENQNQRDSATANMIMGLIGSAVQMGSGIMSDKLGAVLGGGLTGAKAVLSKINSDMFIYDKGSTTLSSDLTNNFTFMDAWIRETHFDIDKSFIPNYSEFIRMNGFKWGVYGYLNNVLDDDGVHYVPSGYTEIPEIYYTPDTQPYITKTEIDEIVSLARDGIIL